MAPEQREAPGEVDHRADIYSLGVVFYELLTGELPAGGFAPPSARSDADARVDAIVRQALEKEPARRQRDAGEVRTQIETVMRGPAEAATMRGSPSGSAKLALGFLLAGILVPLLLLAFHQLNAGGLALTTACFLLAAIFGTISRREWLGGVSARASIISWALAGVVIVTLLVGSQVLASRRALMASMRAREAEAMARREFMTAFSSRGG